MSLSTQIIDFLKADLKAYSPTQHVVTVSPDGDSGLHAIDYHTVYHNDFLSIFSCLAMPEIAPVLSKVVIRSEDKGVNGTQYWDLKRLLSGEGEFTNLIEFEFPMNGRSNHNRIIVTYRDSYDENGGLGLLLDKCPQLRTLATPSAPNEDFFARASHPLWDLQVQSGYDHQGFIQNLSESTCFPSLERLVFRDYAESYMDDFEAQCTPYAAYEALAQSLGLPALKEIVVQDSILDAPQQAALQDIAKSHGRKLEFMKL